MKNTINLTTKESLALNLVVKYRKNPALQREIEQTLLNSSHRVRVIAFFILNPPKREEKKDVHAKIAKRLVSISERLAHYSAVNLRRRQLHSDVGRPRW